MSKIAERPALVRDGERVEIPLSGQQHQMIATANAEMKQAEQTLLTIVNAIRATAELDGPYNWQTETKDGAFVLVLTKAPPG